MVSGHMARLCTRTLKFFQKQLLRQGIVKHYYFIKHLKTGAKELKTMSFVSLIRYPNKIIYDMDGLKGSKTKFGFKK